MSTGDTYVWGCVGGFVAAVLVYVVPSVTQAALTGLVAVSGRKLVAMAVLVTFLSLAAGVVALIPDEVSRGQAISIGFASQTIMKGLLSGARDALAPQAQGT